MAKDKDEWTCDRCVRRYVDGEMRVVAACFECLPMHQRTEASHPNPLERPELRKDDWFEDYAEVVAFGHHLAEDNDWTVSELFEYLEKPWHWTPEYTAWEGRK